MTKFMTAQEQFLFTAFLELGYSEKASNQYLYEKLSNPGSANYTKYAKDLDDLGVYNGKKNGYAWCDMFVDWCFVKAFGLELALKMTGQKKGGYGAGCTDSARYYKEMGRFYKTNPEPGDQIFFTKDGSKTFYHTGIVRHVDGSYVYTIEGNTSSKAGVVENGGSVEAKVYKRTYNRIGGYGRPRWELVKKEEEEDMKLTANDILSCLSEENAYTLLTKAIHHAEGIPEPEWSKQEGWWATAETQNVIHGAPESIVRRDQLIAILGRLGLLSKE